MVQTTSQPQIDSSTEVDASPIPLLDVPVGNLEIRDKVLGHWEEAFDKGMFIGGQWVRQLENVIADICDTKHGIACASGSDALILALMAKNIGPGDEVIVPAFTFFATASAVWRVGAKLVFADIDPNTFNLDPAKVKEKITPNTKAIIPVHLFGQAADMASYKTICSDHDLILIEDAAQSIGARFDGKPVGTIGDIGCFSFYPSKNLGGFGDGGVMTTNDDDYAKWLRIYANHGMTAPYKHDVVGINSRLDSLQAAGLWEKAQKLDQIADARRQNAARYQSMFTDCGLDGKIGIPAEAENCHHVWNQFTVRVPDGRRDEIKNGLGEAKIGSAIYYPIALHMQPCFESAGCSEGELPVTEEACGQVLSLPIYPGLSEAQQKRVVDSIKNLW